MKLFYKLICFIHYYFDMFIDAVFQLYYRENKIRIPIPENNIVLESATNLATKIRNKCLSCEQVVLAFIHRINQINGIVNGIVDNRFNDALIEAKQIDERIKTDSISDKEFSEKPFLGLYFTQKNNFTNNIYRCSFYIQRIYTLQRIIGYFWFEKTLRSQSRF